MYDEFSEHHQLESIKSTKINAQLALFSIQLRCRFNTHFTWVQQAINKCLYFNPSNVLLRVAP